jgi:hypothetical protein
MSHHSARAQWNTANARLANKPFDDLFAEKKPEPPAPVILCRDLMQLLEALADMNPVYPAELKHARRAAFLAQIHAMQPDDCDGPEARLAAIDNALGQEYDLETVNNLLEEKAELQIQLEKE